MKEVREVRIEFLQGVRFPGGAVKERATVKAVVESLEEVRRVVVAYPDKRPAKTQRDIYALCQGEG